MMERRYLPGMRRHAGIALVGVVLFFCYLGQSRSYGVDSDAASQALQAWDMLHGNVLLHGWTLSDVSFYTTELPEYMLVEAVRGLTPDVVHVCAALTYTALVLLAALLAAQRGGLPGALVAGGIMVAPSLSPETKTLLQYADHTGTGVPLLVLFILLERLPRRREVGRDREVWYVPVLMFAGLVWVQVADSMATYAGAVPLALVCAARAACAGRSGAGGWPDRARAGLPDAWLALAAASSIPAAELVLRAIRAAGGFYVHQASQQLASLSALPGHARVLSLNVARLFGVSISGDSPEWAAALHLVGFALAIWALAAGLRRIIQLDLVSQVLITGLLLVIAAGLFGTYMVGLNGLHEIVIVLPYGAVLAGRLLTPQVLTTRLRGWLPRRLATVGVVPLLLVVVGIGYLAALGYDSTRASEPAQNQSLATWLRQHDLTHGLAGYWQADEVRLDSGNKVQLAPVADGRADHWESKQEWFSPAAANVNFVVTVPQPGDPTEPSSAEVIATFGEPAETYRFGPYTIMVWHENLLPTLDSVSTNTPVS